MFTGTGVIVKAIFAWIVTYVRLIVLVKATASPSGAKIAILAVPASLLHQVEAP